MLTAAWIGGGRLNRPDVGAAGRCARCGSVDQLVATNAVVSKVFTAFDVERPGAPAADPGRAAPARIRHPDADPARPSYAVLRQHPVPVQAQVLHEWDQLDPWRAAYSAYSPWLALALHITRPTSKETAA